MKSSRISLFDCAFRILLVFLPFTTILSVFTSQILGIPGVTYLKEILLFAMGGYILFQHVFSGEKIKWHMLDFLLIAYIGVMIVITIFTTGKTGLLYGGRYDFEFLLAFAILFHGARFLAKPSGYYIKLVLISGGLALFFSLLVRFVFSPDILLYFGFSGNPSNWEFGVAPPIFHGVDGANVERFQGILDGPNSMGAFLIIYAGLVAYYFRNKKDWHYLVGLFLIFCLGLEFLTYSRSALGAFIIGALIIFLDSFGLLFRRYKKELFLIGGLIIVIFGIFSIQYRDKAEALLAREGSSKGHFERMITGIDRFVAHPLGQGLGSAGPGARYVLARDGFTEAEIQEQEPYYIPESWYIQQLIEGGIFGAFFFLAFFLVLGRMLFRASSIMFAIFIGICAMNFFLHTFEVTYLSVLIFMIFGLILAGEKKNN